MHPQTAKLIARISENLPEMPDDLMQNWIDNPRGLKRTLQSALCPPEEAGAARADGVKTTRPTFSLKINPKLSAKERIAAGNYNWHDDDLLKWKRKDQSIYTGKEMVVVEAEYFHFNKDISTDQAEREMDEAGYRPANFEELTAHGEQNPKEQRKYPIIALKSVFVSPARGDLCSPCLGRFDSERDLRLSDRDDGWDGSCRFLAVRK